MIKKSLALVFSALVITSCSSGDDAASGSVTSTLVVDQDGNLVATDSQQPSPTVTKSDEVTDGTETTEVDTQAASADFSSYTRVDIESFGPVGFFLADGETACNLQGTGLACTRVVGEAQREGGSYFGYKTDKPTVMWNPSAPNTEIFWDSGYPSEFTPGEGKLNPGEYFERPGMSCWSNDASSIACFGGVAREGWHISHGQFEEFSDPAPHIKTDQILESYVKFTLDGGATGYLSALNGNANFGNLNGFNIGEADDAPGQAASLVFVMEDGTVRKGAGSFGQDVANHRELIAGETRDFHGFTVANNGDSFVVTFPNGKKITLSQDDLAVS